MIDELRAGFNREFDSAQSNRLLAQLEQACGTAIGFSVADTPVFFPRSVLDSMAEAGAQMALALIDSGAYLDAAHAALPASWRVPGETPHPNFIAADFNLMEGEGGKLVPRLVEIQGCASSYAFQAALGETYRNVFALDEHLGAFLGGLDEARFWTLLTRTVLGANDPAHVVLAALDPTLHPAYPDFEATARRLGIKVADPRSFISFDHGLHYRGQGGQLVPIRRVYNRLSNEELFDAPVRLPFDLLHPWNVEWAGHPNWSFLMGRFSLPWLARPPLRHPMAAPAVFLDDFLEGSGRRALQSAGVPLPHTAAPGVAYDQLVLKPLFPIAGQGIRLAPLHAELEAVVPARRRDYILQQRLRPAPAIETPGGPVEAGIRILYLWPDQGLLTPVLPSLRLERKAVRQDGGNGAHVRPSLSAAFFPIKDGSPAIPLQLPGHDFRF